MFDALNETLQSVLKPATDLYKLNAQFASSLVAKQSEIITDTLSETVSLVESMINEKDFNAAIELQKGFAENLQQKYSEAGKVHMEELSELKDKASVLVEEVVAKGKEGAQSLYKAANDAGKQFTQTA